jgi:hypothetical protein
MQMSGSGPPRRKFLGLEFWQLVLSGLVVALLAAGVLALVHRVAHQNGSASPTTSDGSTLTQSSGSTQATSSPSSNPISPGSTFNGSGCILTLDYNDFAALYSGPSPGSAVVGRVPSGTYSALSRQLVNWGGKNFWFYKINADSRTGWVDNDGLQVSATSPSCTAT